MFPSVLVVQSSKYTDFIQLMVNADEEKRQAMQQNGGDTSSSNGQPAGKP